MLDANSGQTAPSPLDQSAIPAVTRVADEPAATPVAALPDTGADPRPGGVGTTSGAGTRSGNAGRSPSGNAASHLWMDTSAEDRELERMHHGTPIQCQFCVGQKFRRSRLRAADIRQLLLMRYPVRCTRCSQRQTVSFTVAGVSIPSYLRQRDGRPSGSRRPDPDSASLPLTRERTAPDAARPQAPVQPHEAASGTEPDA